MTEAIETAAPKIISRFADPDATETDYLPGPCRCPGQPHERDSATWRTELGSGEVNSIRTVGWQSTGMQYYDWEAANDAAIAKAVLSWSFIDAEGEPIPITRRMASLLDEPTRLWLLRRINGGSEVKPEQNGRLPKASGRRSRGSSPANASRTPTATSPS
jgi:hypothetical protein